MVKQSVLWRKIETHYSIVALDEKNSTCKNTKYRCNYCSQVYASNVTRMSLHLMKDCIAPIPVKQEIRNIYTKSETSTSANKHFKLNARWSHVSQHYVKLNAESFPNCKKEKYMCIYCNNRYANNVTRMAQHVMECAHCPPQTKNLFYKLNKPKSSSILSALPATFNSLNDDDDGDHSGTFLYADDTINPISGNNSFDEEMEPLEEKYDITEHITEGVENIQTGGCFKMDMNHEMNEEEIKMLMARACYSTSTQLNIFENTHWKQLFHVISPNINLPTRSELSDKYLNNEYSRIKKEVENKIKDARKLSIQLIGNNNTKLSTIVLILNTPEPVVYDIFHVSNIDHTINKIIQENNKHTFYSIIDKNCDNLEFNTTFPNKHVSRYKCNKYVLNSLIQDLMNLDVFKIVLKKYKSIAEEINFDKSVCISSTKQNVPSFKHRKQLCANLEKMITNKSSLQKLAKGPKKQQIKSKDTILDENGFWTHITTFVNLLRPIVNWMNKIKPDSCISSVVECYSHLKKIFDESNVACILECWEKSRNVAISEVHKAASLLDPHHAGRNLSAGEVIDAIEFINKLSKILPDVKSDKIIYDIAAYRTKQGIWGKAFVWDSLIASEVPAIIWWQSMCSSTELSKVAVSVLSCPPVSVTIEKFGKIRKIEYVKHNLRLLAIRDTLYEQNNSEIYASDDSGCTDYSEPE